MASAAIFAPGSGAVQVGRSAPDAPQARGIEALWAGSAIFELGAKRRCSAQKTLSPAIPVFQLDKSLADEAFALAAQSASTAYAPEAAPSLAQYGPAPEHGPPRLLS